MADCCEKSNFARMLSCARKVHPEGFEWWPRTPSRSPALLFCLLLSLSNSLFFGFPCPSVQVRLSCSVHLSPGESLSLVSFSHSLCIRFPSLSRSLSVFRFFRGRLRLHLPPLYDARIATEHQQIVTGERESESGGVLDRAYVGVA